MTNRPNSILVINYGGIGDILLSTPLLATLRIAFPHATIDTYIQHGRAGILEGNPDLDNIWITRTRHGVRSYVDFLTSHTQKYDLALSLRTSDRQVLFARAAARTAISLLPEKQHTQAWKQRVLSGWAYQNLAQHFVFDTLALAKILNLTPVYTCRPPSSTRATLTFQANQARLLDSGPYAIVHLTPRNRYKEWCIPGWQTVFAHLHERGLNIVVLGSDDNHEKSYAHHVLKNCPFKVTNLCGQTSLAEAAALLRDCQLYVGPDTMMSHLAASLDKPTVALFGRWIAQYPPYHDGLVTNPFILHGATLRQSQHVWLVTGTCSCVEQNQVCADESTRPSGCMQSIDHETVIDTIDRSLTHLNTSPYSSRLVAAQ